MMGANLFAAPVELKIKALDGAPLETAGIGVPFLVEVTAGGRDTYQKPVIAGLDTFQVQTAGIRVYTVNGDTSSTYTYKVRIDQPGTYVIGPATLSINGVQSQSKAIRIVVANTQTIDQTYAKKVRANATDALVQLSTDKTQCFVGERVMVSLTFLGKKDKAKLEQLEEPKIPEFHMGTKVGPIAGIQTINGSEYSTVTWTWELFPKKDGQFIIPACGANYQVEQEMNDNLSFFSPFFRVRAERKRTYSNACTLTVDPLPAHTGHVDAVGTFKRFDATINPPVAQEGEGMVLMLEVEGDGDLAKIPIPQLHNMPPSLKWYDSKQYIRDTHGIHGLPVKCFEYIVQGLEQGSWEIPSQTFTYFDVAKRQYVTLKTAFCSVTINPNPATKKASSSPQASGQQYNANATAQDETILPLNTWGSLRPIHHRSPMSWWLFFVLALLPAVWAAIMLSRIIVRSRADYFKQRFAFKQARKKINESARQGISRTLHTIFIELFASRLQCATSIVSQEIIDQTLRHAGMADDEMRSWEQFYTRMYEKAFFESGSARHDNEALCKEALVWVTKLEKIL